ncbi:hypothetical protein PENTCL1PPCAC_10709 [Pristionchus entomophagus]|uniref:Small-subunit processome Utp12 domain-containing protein n=1 Tax=Pristionchus entomophagus TaxID=358040 RepID=A0AAV5T027_9BILA|nr:hypothetical protein PENTCL1PPCAC_10709 [Pristionchus entomophagus]
MDINFRFSNLFGSVYKNGNILFSHDGNSVISPVGNKVTITDLKNNVSRTLNIEALYNITTMAINNSGSHLLIANEKGEILYVNMVTEAIVFRFRAKRSIKGIQFSPDCKSVAITRGEDLQIHEIAAFSNLFSPLSLKTTYKISTEHLTCVSWSSDSRLICVGSQDKQVKVVGSKRIANAYIVPLGGHKADIVAAQFLEGSYDLISVDRRGLANTWKCSLKEADIVYGNVGDEEKAPRLRYEKNTKFHLSDHNGEGRHIDVSACRLHAPSNLLVTAFANGVFVLHEVPSFSLIHSLRVSSLSISSVGISPSGDWLALGCGHGSQGQLIVWEWQSESYILKQQSHQLSIKSARFSPDASLLATAGEDGKVKVWNTRSCFCIVTFDEHTSSAMGIAWTQSGKAVLSSSLDGTVRARDMKRYRNFRTLVCPDPTPLGALEVDSSGDVVCAAAVEMFQIFIWSMENGQLIDVLSGHASTIADISLRGNTLASVSFDKTLRLWNLVDSSSETMDLTAEGVALAFAPTKDLVAILSLDSMIALVEGSSTSQIGSIDCKYDLDSARSQHDKITKDSSEKSKTFTTLSFSPDSSLLLVGGQSNNVCLYSVEDKLLLRRFAMTINRSFDGVILDINRRNYSEFGNMHLIDTSDSEEELDGKKAIKLAGTRNGDKGERKGRPLIEVNYLAFCPTGRRFCVCATTGVEMYSLDAHSTFDPFQLDMSISKGEVKSLLSRKEFAHALKGSIQLGDSDLIRKCIEQTPVQNIVLLCSSLSLQYAERLLKWMTDPEGFQASTQIELYMKWLHSLVVVHAAALKEQEKTALLTDIQQTIQYYSRLLSNLAENNINSLEYLIAARKLRRPKKEKEEDEVMEE